MGLGGGGMEGTHDAEGTAQRPRAYGLGGGESELADRMHPPLVGPPPLRPTPHSSSLMAPIWSRCSSHTPSPCRAVAAQTNATVLKLAGPQLVQMFIGDGAKMVRDAFALAKEKAPCIIFIGVSRRLGLL